jgi:hypothetical protein
MDNITEGILIATNDRFDKLTNLDISTHYKDRKYWLMRSDFNSAFAYWVVYQSPYDTPNITPSLIAFGKYIATIIPEREVVNFSYTELSEILSEKIFEKIPEIEALNHRKNDRDGNGFCSRYEQPNPDDDFIDLSALSRNIFYMILRNSITNG